MGGGGETEDGTIYIYVLFWGALGGISGYTYGISISIGISSPDKWQHPRWVTGSFSHEKLSYRQHRSKAQESRSILILKLRQRGLSNPGASTKWGYGWTAYFAYIAFNHPGSNFQLPLSW